MKTDQLVNEVDDHGVERAGEENVRLNSTDFESKVEVNESWVKTMSKCDIFYGKWVREDLNPSYKPGSCPYIDEPFNCYLNGRPDNGFEKYTWRPNHCSIPRQEEKCGLSFILDKFEHGYYISLFNSFRSFLYKLEDTLLNYSIRMTPILKEDVLRF